jgi:Spy/CpxP family protein refolding chaperone
MTKRKDSARPLKLISYNGNQLSTLIPQGEIIMQTHRLRHICFATILALLLTTLPALAFGPGDGGGPGHGPGSTSEDRQAMREARMEKMDILLDLTPEQKEQLQTFRKSHRAEGATFHEEMQAVRKEIGDEIEKPELDMAKISQLQTRLKELQARQADHRLEGILNVRQTLTPAQFTKFMVMTKDHKRGMGRMGKCANQSKE